MSCRRKEPDEQGININIAKLQNVQNAKTDELSSEEHDFLSPILHVFFEWTLGVVCSEKVAHTLVLCNQYIFLVQRPVLTTIIGLVAIHLRPENGLKLHQLPLEAFIRVNTETSMLHVLVGLFKRTDSPCHHIGNNQRCTARYSTDSVNEHFAIIRQALVNEFTCLFQRKRLRGKPQNTIKRDILCESIE